MSNELLGTKTQELLDALVATTHEVLEGEISTDNISTILGATVSFAGSMAEIISETRGDGIAGTKLLISLIKKGLDQYSSGCGLGLSMAVLEVNTATEQVRMIKVESEGKERPN